MMTTEAVIPTSEENEPEPFYGRVWNLDDDRQEPTLAAKIAVQKATLRRYERLKNLDKIIKTRKTLGELKLQQQNSYGDFDRALPKLVNVNKRHVMAALLSLLSRFLTSQGKVFVADAKQKNRLTENSFKLRMKSAEGIKENTNDKLAGVNKQITLRWVVFAVETALMIISLTLIAVYGDFSHFQTTMQFIAQNKWLLIAIIIILISWFAMFFNLFEPGGPIDKAMKDAGFSNDLRKAILIILEVVVMLAEIATGVGIAKASVKTAAKAAKAIILVMMMIGKGVARGLKIVYTHLLKYLAQLFEKMTNSKKTGLILAMIVAFILAIAIAIATGNISAMLSVGAAVTVSVVQTVLMLIQTMLSVMQSIVRGVLDLKHAKRLEKAAKRGELLKIIAAIASLINKTSSKESRVSQEGTQLVQSVVSSITRAFEAKEQAINMAIRSVA